MTWFYAQKTGIIRHNEEVVNCGYSGARECKNVPEAQDKHNRGPIPRGQYRITQPQDSVEHGPFVLRLIPDADNTMFGRGGFLIHGDSRARPGDASEGCIILDNETRHKIWSSADHDLEVTE